MLGANDVWRPQEFEPQMRKIVEFSIENGVIPILATKADNQEGDGSSVSYTHLRAHETPEHLVCRLLLEKKKQKTKLNKKLSSFLNYPVSHPQYPTSVRMINELEQNSINAL